MARGEICDPIAVLVYHQRANDLKGLRESLTKMLPLSVTTPEYGHTLVEYDTALSYFKQPRLWDLL